jgi:hypothetical protein
MSQWNQVQRRLHRVQRVAQLLDDRFAVPGTRIRFGLDSVLGVLPGLGDVATAAASLWLIGEAYRLKVPRKVLLRMLINVGVDSTLGAVPLAGDLFDVYFKSNRRNAKLLQQHLERQTVAADPAPARRWHPQGRPQ